MSVKSIVDTVSGNSSIEVDGSDLNFTWDETITPVDQWSSPVTLTEILESIPTPLNDSYYTQTELSSPMTLPVFGSVGSELIGVDTNVFTNISVTIPSLQFTLEGIDEALGGTTSSIDSLWSPNDPPLPGGATSGAEIIGIHDEKIGLYPKKLHKALQVYESYIVNGTDVSILGDAVDTLDYDLRLITSALSHPNKINDWNTERNPFDHEALKKGNNLINYEEDRLTSTYRALQHMTGALLIGVHVNPSLQPGTWTPLPKDSTTYQLDTLTYPDETGTLQETLQKIQNKAVFGRAHTSQGWPEGLNFGAGGRMVVGIDTAGDGPSSVAGQIYYPVAIDQTGAISEWFYHDGASIVTTTDPITGTIRYFSFGVQPLAGA